MKKPAATKKATRQPLIESLESRQLMSAVVDVRLPGGGKTVTNPTVGQKINLEVWVTITGSDNDITNEQLQFAAGSILSTNIGGGVVKGNLTSTLVAPFNAAGSQNGTAADLDGDGDLDIGSNTPSVGDNFLIARSASMTTSGTAVTKGQAFKIATAQFTVTSLLTGNETDIKFRQRGTNNNTTIYNEDGNLKVSPTGVLTEGTGVQITRTPNSTVSGRVFNDKNANGIFDGNDTGISGFRVFLDKDADGILDAGETSKPVSATGTFTFSAVTPGTYRLREVFRDGWRQSYPALGYYEINVGYDQAFKTLSFANTDTVLIKGRVWMDSDQDRVIDSAEAGLANWRLYFDQNNNGIFDSGETSTLSDVNGNYRFFNIPAGKYLVRIVQQTGYKRTAPAGGAHTVTLAAGQTTSNKNFGEKRLK